MGVDIEREAIALLTDSVSVRVMADEGISPEHFFDIESGVIFGWALDYFYTHGKCSETPTAEMLDNVFPADPAGATMGYSVIVAGALGGHAASYVCELIREKFVKEEVRGLLKDSTAVVSASPMEAALALQQGAADVLIRATRKIDRVEYAKDIAFIRARNEQRAAAGGEKTVPYFLPEVAEHTGGIALGEIHFLVGQPAMGKSFFGCAQALGAARAGWNTMYATLEMSEEVIEKRIEALETRTVQFDDYRKGRLLPQQQMQVYEAQERIVGLEGKLVIEAFRPTERTLSNIMSRARMSGCEFVVLDQLQFVDHPEGLAGVRPDLTPAIIYDMKNQVNSHAGKIALMCLHQFNRNVKDAPKGIATMHDLAHSSTVEQVADAVLAVGRDNEMKVNRHMHLKTLKARNFTPATWCLNWDLDRGRSEIDFLSEVPWEV